MSFNFQAMDKYLYVCHNLLYQELNLIFIFFLSMCVCVFFFNSRKQCNGGQKPKLFGYNVVFEPGASQNDVLEYSGIKRIIEMAIEGFSCTAFCYGQTGSGKTHTLTGPPELVIWHFLVEVEFETLYFISAFDSFLKFIGKPEPNDSRHGLVFRAFLYLFQLLQERKDTNFVLKASFLEIYNEKVSLSDFDRFVKKFGVQ